MLVGPPKSGKSLRAEHMAESCGSTQLYFATLPRLEEFASCIEKHRARRGPTWHLYEATGRPDLDLQALEQGLSTHPVVLLDGLTQLIWLYVSEGALGPHWIEGRERLLSVLGSARNSWIVVDPHPLMLGTEEFSFWREVWTVHSAIAAISGVHVLEHEGETHDEVG
jgi:adenosyl cobinamide kinase/adenosyl cobinamide phosphate guanylyltransferase